MPVTQYVLLSAFLFCAGVYGVLAGLVAVLIFGVLAYLLADEFRGDKLELVQPTQTSAIADSIFRSYVVAFEAVSMLLLAALIGAIVLARRD